MQNFLKTNQKPLLLAGLSLGFAGMCLYHHYNKKMQAKSIKPLESKAPIKFLTQKMAEKRFEQISNVNYRMILKQSDEQTYSALLQITFKRSDTKDSNLFLDFVGGDLKEVQINFQSIGPITPEIYDGYWLTLPNQYLKLGDNVITISFSNKYTKDGNGFHCFVDTDKQQYCYTNFEPDHCRKWFPCFDQPDLKATLKLTVITHKKWKLIANEPIISDDIFRSSNVKARLAELQSDSINFLEGISEDYKIVEFAETQRLPTYLFALITGPFAEHKCLAPYRNIPMSIYCRESLTKYMDNQKDEIFEFLNKGLEFYEKFFGVPYPFSKYDQIFCPEFNVGAMENPGAVTFNDTHYVFKDDNSIQTNCRRGRTIVHELAHMWFGDLVTMKWWNDLWLNESFADFAAIVCLKNCKYSFPAADFNVVGHLMKSWGYSEDQLQTTHPIAGDVADTAQADDIFDGITYSKGSSVVLQLYYLVGHENFSKALASYFKKFSWKNAVLKDFLDECDRFFNMEFSLQDWCEEWICTAGLNEVEVNEFNNNVISLKQRSALTAFPRLRSHKMKIALYSENGLVERKDIFLKGQPETKIELNNLNYSAVLPNYSDETFIKVCLDVKSIAFFKEHLAAVKEPGARILVWRAFYDMVRDAKVSAEEFISLVGRFIDKESEFTLLNYVLTFAGMSLNAFTPKKHKSRLSHILYLALKNLLTKGNFSKEDQVTLKGKLISFAIDDDLNEMKDWIEGNNNELKRFNLSLENEWSIITKIHYSPKFNLNLKKILLEKQLAKDSSDQALRNKEDCLASIATLSEKENLWNNFVKPDLNIVSEKILAARMDGFNHENAYPENDVFINKFFDLIANVFDNNTSRYARSFYDHLYPSVDNLDLLLKKNAETLAKIPKNLTQLERALKETNDSLERKKKCFACFERGSL